MDIEYIVKYLRVIVKDDVFVQVMHVEVRRARVKLVELFYQVVTGHLLNLFIAVVHLFH